MRTIISAGHICVDIAPVIPGQGLASVSDYLVPGRLTQTDGVSVGLGGSVGNTGLALRKIGADVRMLGKVGEDAFGELVQRIAHEQGCSGIIVDPAAKTSYTIVIAPPGIDRCFLHDPGANDTFRASDIPSAALEDAAVFHFGYPTLMRQMFESDGEELVTMFRRVGSLGIATSLDLTVVDPAGPAGKANWERILERTLPYVDFFVPSYEELLYMLDYEKWKTMPAGNGDFKVSLEADAIPLARKALSMGCRAVLLKCGTSGMVLLSADHNTMSRTGARLGLDPELWSMQRICQECYPAEIVRNTTGAGDVSIAAFLTALVRGKKPVDCVRLAAAEGACSVTEYDSISGLLPLDELEERISAGWK